MSIPIPQTEDQVSAQWLQEILQSAGILKDRHITGIKRRRIGDEHGFMSVTLSVALTYDGDAANAPASVVVKLLPQAEQFREFEAKFGVFDRESKFYHELAGKVDVRVPHVYFATGGAEGKVLVMEDLSRLTTGNQLHGLRHEQVLMVVRAIAKVHAAYWDNDALRALDWVPDHSTELDEGVENIWPEFVSEYELRIGRDGVQLGERAVSNLAWFQQRVRERPATLVHSDMRADNLLFGTPGSPDEVCIIDWQLLNRTLGAIDPTQLFGGSEPAAERRGHHLEVFTAWHETLLQGGVTGYPMEEALDDFRLGALHAIYFVLTCYSARNEHSGVAQYRLLDVMAERYFASALALEAGKLLP